MNKSDRRTRDRTDALTTQRNKPSQRAQLQLHSRKLNKVCWVVLKHRLLSATWDGGTGDWSQCLKHRYNISVNNHEHTSSITHEENSSYAPWLLNNWDFMETSLPSSLLWFSLLFDNNNRLYTWIVQAMNKGVRTLNEPDLHSGRGACRRFQVDLWHLVTPSTKPKNIFSITPLG